MLFLQGGSLEITLTIPLRIEERREYEIGLENGKKYKSLGLKKEMIKRKERYDFNPVIK